jgi:hypothetical protein
MRKSNPIEVRAKDRKRHSAEKKYKCENIYEKMLNLVHKQMDAN